MGIVAGPGGKSEVLMLMLKSHRKEEDTASKMTPAATMGPR